MKRAKKLIWLLVTAAMFAAAPLTAMALPAGGYVPTSGTTYYKDSTTNKWKKSFSFVYTFKEDGRLTKSTQKYTGGGSFSQIYTWKGNYITKLPSSYASAATYKYSKKKLVSFRDAWSDKTDKIKWKGKTGTVTVNGRTTEYTINGKGQLIKMLYKYDGYVYDTITYQYYGNGNLKSSIQKYSGGGTYTTKYNKKGYKTLYEYKDDSYWNKTTFKYTTKNGKITQVVKNYSSSGGSKSSNKIVFKKWQYVSHVRNCDAWGRELPLVYLSTSMYY